MTGFLGFLGSEVPGDARLEEQQQCEEHEEGSGLHCCVDSYYKFVSRSSPLNNECHQPDFLTAVPLINPLMPLFNKILGTTTVNRGNRELQNLSSGQTIKPGVAGWPWRVPEPC